MSPQVEEYVRTALVVYISIAALLGIVIGTCAYAISSAISRSGARLAVEAHRLTAAAERLADAVEERTG